MKRICSLTIAIALVSAATAAVKELDWATFEYPDAWDYRAPDTKGFDVKVTLKKAAPISGNWLQPHLHWMTAGGYGGFQQWSNPIKNPQVGKTYTFHYKPKVDEDKVHRYAFCGYLAPNGDYNKKMKEQFVDIRLPPPPAYEPKPADCLFKKSYIRIDEQPAPVKVGEEVVLKVHYYLDPSETWGPKQSKLSVTPLGPWIDNPDGVINKSRHHVSYGGTMFTKEMRIEPGEHTVEFRFKLGVAYRYNSCFFLCKFKTPDNKDWPWDFRGGSLAVVPSIDVFRLSPTARGGLFFLDETPSVALTWSGRQPGGQVTGTATVKDALNRTVLTRPVKLNPARQVQMLNFPELQAKGVFALTVKAPGLGKDGADFKDFCTFGRIPRFERQDGRPTPFGVTNVSDLDLSELAYDMGFSLVRHFTAWKGIEPMRGKFALAGLDRAVSNNAAAGLKPWIQLYAPPAWTLPPEMGKTGEFEPAPFKLDDWANILDVLAKRYRGKLYGFEFMNELVPGKACEDPVKTYLDICRVGYDTVKRNDPSLVCQLAGGLWPHSFRVDLLNAGVAKYIDVLPVHYSTYEGVSEAKRDLARFGSPNVRVGDNETAKGYSVWNYPPEMSFEKSLVQCHHVMTRWPDELCAGAAFITYFGGNADACGNWSFMLDQTSPRPVAATLAVVQGKLAYAKPIGKFFIGETVCHLFERDGKAILFLSTPGREGVRVTIPVAAGVHPRLTDFQGNKTALKGDAVITGDMPVIVEGVDLAALKLHAALSLGSGAPSALPQVTALAPRVPVTVSNPFADTRTFRVGGSSVTLAAGATKTFEAEVAAKPGANQLTLSVETKGLAPVSKPFVLYLTEAASLGNLAQNGAFDSTGAPWKGDGRLVDAPQPGASANRALAIAGKGKGYLHQTQMVDLPIPGGTYLYSAWLRGEGMGGGSNLDEYDALGKHLKNHMMLNVFALGGEGSKGWQYFSKRIVTKPQTAKLALTPVATGSVGKRILYDNVQLSLDRGLDFQSFAAPDAAQSALIPLLCENRVKSENGYVWSEKNLAGVARFSWSTEALVFAVEVEDDVMDARPVVSASGEETLAGDALALSIFPRQGADGLPTADEVRWYISKASPGGGSGSVTVFRPKSYAMGAKDGQLCKDSSVYQVRVTRENTLTRYHLTIPWSEIPGFTPAVGASFGCRIRLTDADGSAARGEIDWGLGFVTLFSRQL